MKELESALGALQPAGAAHVRDNLFFQAGAAHGRRRAWVWPGISAALLACLTISLVTRPADQMAERVVYVTVPSAQAALAQPAQPNAIARYEMPTVQDIKALRQQAASFKLRQAVLEKGLDALPAASAGGSGGPRQDTNELMDELLRGA
jgi:hypothetical protein